MPEIRIRWQPKQWQVLQHIENSQASYIGVGGGRGCAKSFMLDAIMLALSDTPGFLGCIVMRNYDQVRKYHIEEMFRNYPWLRACFHKGDSKLVLGSSQIDFAHAEAGQSQLGETNVERKFRSGNYHVIAVDQAEQFLESEIREMKNASRVGLAKMLLSFNMGGAGIQTLRKWFHTHEYGPNDSASNYEFVHVYPWDNVTWSLGALAQDGLTEEEYYSWPDQQRMDYCAARSAWGQSLNALDDPLRNRDWLGSWDSLEGAYFGRVFDRAACLITHDQVKRLIKPWDSRWISQDWGKSHFNSTHWHARTLISPDQAEEILGWANVKKPIKAVLTYRELIVNEMTSTDVARKISEMTPDAERSRTRSFYLSPDAFGDKDAHDTIADRMGAELRRHGMPAPDPADNERVGGWMLMYNLMADTRRRGASDGEVWLISAECPQALEALPLAMRDSKNLDDVLKTDKGHARVEQDVLDDLRYGLKTMLSPGTKPKRVVLDETLSQQTGMQRLHTILTFEQQWQKQHPGLQRKRRYQ